MTANWKRLLRACVRVGETTVESDVQPAVSLTGASLLPRTSVAAGRADLADFGRQ